MKVGPHAYARLADVPFLILPAGHDEEFVVYRGYDDFTAVALGLDAVHEVIVDLLRV